MTGLGRSTGFEPTVARWGEDRKGATDRMTAEVAKAGTRGRIEFSTTDPDLAIGYLQSAYGANMKVSGARGGHVYAHSRLDGARSL